MVGGDFAKILRIEGVKLKKITIIRHLMRELQNITLQKFFWLFSIYIPITLSIETSNQKTYYLIPMATLN